MASESGFESAVQQPGPWSAGNSGGGGAVGGLISGGLGGLGPLGGGLGGLAGGIGGVGGGGGVPWLEPGTGVGSQWADGGETGAGTGAGKEVTVKPDQHSVPAVKDAIAEAAGGPGKAAPQQQAILSPDKLDAQFKDKQGADFARAQALGLTAEQYKQQYLHEFMARLSQTDPFSKGPDGKPLLGKDGKPVSNYSAAQQNSLSAWGYNAQIDPSNVVDHNKDTGLFAIRFEPTAAGEKNGRAPVVAFRGTEPDRGTRDLQTDLGDEYIGKSEYEPGKADIARLFGRKPGEKSDVVGYSLGGALAQRSLVDNAQNVRSLSTFQAPGIKGSDADAVNAATQKYGIDVNHHFFTNDIVHRGGEKKTDGTYHEYTRGDWATGINSLDAHLSSFLIPSDGGKGTQTAHGGVNANDSYLNATGPGTGTTIQNYQNDRQGDRAFWEAQRRKAGPAVSGILGEVGPAMNLWQQTDNEGNPVRGPDGKPIPGPLQSAVNQTKGGFGQTKDGLGGLAQGLGEAGHGVLDIFSGNGIKGGLEIGQGLLNGFQGAKDTIGGIGNMWNGAKDGLGTLGGFFRDHVAPHGGDLLKMAGAAPDMLAHLAHDPSIQKKLGPHGGPIVEGLADAYDSAKPLAKQTIGGLKNAGTEIGAGWGDTKAGVKDAAGGLGEAGHGALDFLTGNFGKGAKEMWSGAKQTVSGIGSGFQGAKDMLTGAGHGIGTLKDAWSGAKQIWHDDIASNAQHYKALAGQALKPITQPISNAYHAAQDKVQQLGTGISNGFHTAVDYTKQTASNIGTGISNGFNSAVDATKKTASNIGHGISSGVSSLASKAKKLWPF